MERHPTHDSGRSMKILLSQERFDRRLAVFRPVMRSDSGYDREEAIPDLDHHLGMLTVVATCRQQGRDVLDYLSGCFEAHLPGQKVPSLVPAN